VSRIEERREVVVVLREGYAAICGGNEGGGRR